jgi:ABC-type Co2+ transport system permease subunit
MHTFSKYFEIAYLIIGIVFLGEGILKLSENDEKAYMTIGFGVLAVFMFFFKRRFRKRRE